MNNFELPTDWKQQAQYLTKGGRRAIYIYNNYIIKENYTKKKSHIELDQFEFIIFNNIINSIDEKYKQNFGKIYSKKNNITISELIKNYDNTISKNLSQISNVDIKKSVIKQFEEIINKLLELGFYYYDIRPENIIVKEIKKNEFIPVIFDYKNINRKYLLQPSTYTKQGKINKIKKRLERLKQSI